jgi:hypothetical protein
LSPQDALNLIDQVTARYQGTRQDHELLVTAVHVLRQMVAQPDSAPEVESESLHEVEDVA